MPVPMPADEPQQNPQWPPLLPPRTPSDGPSSESARAALLVKVLEELERRMVQGRKEAVRFIPNSDLRQVWRDDVLDAIIGGDAGQRVRVRETPQLLQILSFAVWAEAPDRFFQNFRSLAFSPPESTNVVAPVLPLTKEGLVEKLQIAPRVAKRTWAEQYFFLPATIEFDGYHQHTQAIDDENVILPLRDYEEGTIHGGYGKVNFCRIDHRYVRSLVFGTPWTPMEPYSVAVKTYKAEHASDATREVANLALLRESLQSPNQYREFDFSLHHAILQQGPRITIIFPRATLGDLWQFINCGKVEFENAYDWPNRFPAASCSDSALATAILDQAVSLAAALRFLHEGFATTEARVYCAHMDLKPNNILLFNHPTSIVGQWKLCDFGISVFKQETTTTRTIGSIGDLYDQLTMNTQSRRGPGAYQAPEIDDSPSGPAFSREGLGHTGVGRMSDIWSFGAVFAELLSFVQQEKDKGVVAFRKARREGTGSGTPNDWFYSLERDTRLTASRRRQAKVRPAVVTWLDEIRSESPEIQAAIDCWVLCIKRTLVVKPKRRPRAYKLHENVKHVREHYALALHGKTCECKYIAKALRGKRIIETRRPGEDDDSDSGESDSGEEANTKSPAKSTETTRLPASAMMIQDQVESAAGSPNEQGITVFESPPSPPPPPPGSHINFSDVETPSIFVRQATGLSQQSQPKQTTPRKRRESDEVRGLGSSGSSEAGNNNMRSMPEDPQQAWSAATSSSNPSSARKSTRGSLTSSSDRSDALTATSVLGAPSNAHGILANPDVERDIRGPIEVVLPSRLPSGLVDIAITDERIAYLASGRVSVYWQPLSPGIRELLLIRTIDLLPTFGWTGLAMAGDYVVVWAYHSGVPTLRIYHLEVTTGHHCICRDTQVSSGIPSFNNMRRMAVSRLGYVAMIGASGQIIVLKILEESGVLVVKQVPLTQRPLNVPGNQTAYDVAFNDTGTLLYAWIVGQQAALCMYRVDAGIVRLETQPSLSSYEPTEKHADTRLIPYNQSPGCVVAASGLSFFAATAKGGVRNTSDELDAVTLGTVCLFGDHSLITTERRSKWGSTRLVERPIERRSANDIVIGEGRTLCKLKRPPETSSRMRAYIWHGIVYVVLCHVNGKVEMVCAEPRGA